MRRGAVGEFLLFRQMIDSILGHDGDVAVVVLGITSLEGVGVPVVAPRTDTDDAALAVVGRIFPCNDSAVATYAEDLTTGAGFPSSVIVVAAPVGTDMVLCCGVSDVVAGISTIDFLWVVACDKSLEERMVVLIVEDTECPRPTAELCIGLVLTPTVVRRSPLIIACNADEGGQVGGVTCEEEGTAILVELTQLVLGCKSLGSLCHEDIVAVDAAVDMEVPPYNLTLVEFNSISLYICEGSVE